MAALLTSYVNALQHMLAIGAFTRTAATTAVWEQVGRDSTADSLAQFSLRVVLASADSKVQVAASTALADTIRMLECPLPEGNVPAAVQASEQQRARLHALHSCVVSFCMAYWRQTVV